MPRPPRPAHDAAPPSAPAPAGPVAPTPATHLPWQAFESGPECGTFAVDADGRIRAWSSGAERLTGYPAEAVLGRPVTVLYAPEELLDGSAAQQLDDALGCGHAQGEGWWMRRDGTRFWARRLIVGVPADTDGGGGANVLLTDLTASHAAHARLQESEECFRSLFERNPEGICCCDLQGRIRSTNAAMDTLLGRAGGRLTGSSVLSLVEASTRAGLAAALERAAHGERGSAEVRLPGEGAAAVLHACCIPFAVDGRPAGLFVIWRDVSTQTFAAEALRESDERFQSLIQGLSQGFFYLLDAEERFRYVSPSILAVAGISPAELIGRHRDELLTPPSHDPAVAGPPAHGAPRAATLRHRAGATREMEVVEVAVDGPDGSTHGFARDVTTQEASVRLLRQSALHDPLTGLANRALFWDRLHHTSRVSGRYPTRQNAVLLLDVDHFKQVNDTHGHMAGDQLLVGLARRLERCVRPSDTVCRFGGDEFAILLSDVADGSSATRVAERIREALLEPLPVAEGTARISTSIGIALSATGHASADELVNSADMALYRAKALGTGRYEIYDPQLRAVTQQRLQLERDLTQVLARDELHVAYQPIFDLRTGRIWGVEALARWQHATRGTIAPAEFVPVAERTGQIVEIDLWVLGEACRQLREWQQRFPELVLKMSVNLSDRLLGSDGLAQRLRQLLQQNHLDAPSLHLEVKERSVADGGGPLRAAAGTLRELDLNLQIDDFGTGPSVLRELVRLPVRTLKLNPTMLATGRAGERLLHALVEMAHGLGLTVVAEGVETEQERNRLRSAGCDFGQGYYWTRPLPAADLTPFLQAASQR